MLMLGVGSPGEHKEPGLRSSDSPDRGQSCTNSLQPQHLTTNEAKIII